MLDQRFYWGTIRKAIVAFGNIFNSITIERKDANGNTVGIQRVPLSYSPKQKFLARIQQQPDIDFNQFNVILPRMGFELTSIQYDPNIPALTFAGFTTANIGSTITSYPGGNQTILTIYIAWY